MEEFINQFRKIYSILGLKALPIVEILIYVAPYFIYWSINVKFLNNAISHPIMWTNFSAGQNQNYLIISLHQYSGHSERYWVSWGVHYYVSSDRKFRKIEKILPWYGNIFVPEDYRVKRYSHFKWFDDLVVKLNLLSRKRSTYN